MNQIDKIKKALELNKTKGAKRLLEEYFRQSHKQQWLENKRAEYNKLFPEYEEDISGNSNSEDLVERIEVPIKVDYSDNPEYKTFDEWLNEVVVVQEATEDEPEITELVREYMLPTDEEFEEYLNNFYLWKEYQTKKAKEAKANLLATMKVELDNLELQADSTSLVYMNSVGTIASKYFNKLLASGANAEDAYRTIYIETTIDWKDANNTVNPVSVETIIDGLELAVRKVGEIVKQNS